MSRLLPALIAILLSASGCSDQQGAAAPKPSGSKGEANPAGAADSVAATTAAATPAQFDWPRWRGPAGTGISQETDWKSTDWPKKGPERLWTAAIGTGFSSFSVAGGRLYTMGHNDDDDTVYCFDAETGKEQWKFSYPCALVDNLHEGGPACTPTVDGQRVYTISKEGHLFCFDAATGDKIWSAELQTLLGIKMPDWGFSCSPLVVDEKLIVEAGSTVALNKANGELIWKTKNYRPGYGSPVLMNTGGQDLVVVLNNDGVLVVQLDDGTEVATYPWVTDYATSSTTPIVSGDTIYISTGYHRGCALLQLKGNQLEPLYENKKMRNHMNNCVLLDGYLYGFDGNSHSRRLVNLVCMDHKTGEVKWTAKSLGCGSLIVAGSKLVVLGDEGELLIAPATPEKFDPLVRAQVIEGKCWTTPVLAHGRIYVRNVAGELACLDVRR